MPANNLGTDGGLMMKPEVNYRRATTDQRCGNCMYFRAPEDCLKVQPPISAMAVCDLWANGEEDATGNTEQLGPGMATSY